MCWEVSDPTAPVFQVTALHVPIYHISLFWEAVTRRLIVDLGGGQYRHVACLAFENPAMKTQWSTIESPVLQQQRTQKGASHV